MLTHDFDERFVFRLLAGETFGRIAELNERYVSLVIQSLEIERANPAKVKRFPQMNKSSHNCSMVMNRKWARNECPICNEVPQKDKLGLFRCSCKRIWQVPLGVAGTSDEEANLKQHGFERTQDEAGDIYYVLPNSGHIIHLYVGGTWCSDEAAKGSSLEEYLSWIEDLFAPLRG